MEIVTYVRTGAITHQDSIGNKGRTAAGDVQVMSAGTGVVHAEYNLEDEQTTLFQIWIETDKPGAQPSWGAMPFPKDSRQGAFQLLASGDPDDGTLTINADARVLGATVKAGESIAIDADANRHLYLVPSGQVQVNGVMAGPRDGVAITGENRIDIEAEDDAEPRNISSTEAQSSALARDRQSARRTESNSPVLTASREPTVLAAPAAEPPRGAAPSSSSVPAVPQLQSSPTKTRSAAALPATV